MLYDGAEVQRMVEDILKNYAAMFDSIRNHAKEVTV